MEQKFYTIKIHGRRAAPRRYRDRMALYDRLYWAANLAVVLIACGFITAGILHEMAAPTVRAADERTHPVLTINSILDRGAAEVTAAPAENAAGLSLEDAELLARLVWLEARGEPAEGQQAVAEVVLNRVAADNFPNTVREVIYEGYGTNCQQFTPAGLIDTAEPTEDQYAAVERAAGGERILPADVVYFSTEAENSRVWGQIGNHVFCHQYIWE